MSTEEHHQETLYIVSHVLVIPQFPCFWPFQAVHGMGSLLWHDTEGNKTFFWLLKFCTTISPAHLAGRTDAVFCCWVGIQLVFFFFHSLQNSCSHKRNYIVGLKTPLLQHLDFFLSYNLKVSNTWFVYLCVCFCFSLYIDPGDQIQVLTGTQLGL